MGSWSDMTIIATDDDKLKVETEITRDDIRITISMENDKRHKVRLILEKPQAEYLVHAIACQLQDGDLTAQEAKAGAKK